MYQRNEALRSAYEPAGIWRKRAVNYGLWSFVDGTLQITVTSESLVNICKVQCLTLQLIITILWSHMCMSTKLVFFVFSSNVLVFLHLQSMLVVFDSWGYIYTQDVAKVGVQLWIWEMQVSGTEVLSYLFYTFYYICIYIFILYLLCCLAWFWISFTDN